MAAIKILVPVDGSEHGVDAVRYVANLSGVLKEVPRVLLLNVQWNVAGGNVKRFINRETISDYYVERGNAALGSARAVLDDAAIPYQYHISAGAPAAAIAKYAREQNVDQIVMSRRGHGGLQSLLLGSVVSRVLVLAPCPVLLIR
jgi:nucleotide-binding universal stress UspA family protein